ncbi:hypothetical protein BGZ76_003702 [Entomortierella beljakovae]|nr:hypothetical protein BGZ76_003702 [Entomortierella beljakovae]
MSNIIPTSPKDVGAQTKIKYFEKTPLRDYRSKAFSTKAIDYPGPLDDASSYTDAASVPNGCTSFRFDANFKDHPTGHYYIAWKLKLLPDFRIPWGFHIKATIYFNEETSESSGLDAVIPTEKFNDIEKDTWVDIITDEPLVVRPHRGSAEIKLSLRNNGDSGKSNVNTDSKIEHSNFMIQCVALLPYATFDHGLQKFSSDPISPFSTFLINGMEEIPVSRITLATDTNHIAILQLSESSYRISIWDFNGIFHAPEDNANSPPWSKITEIDGKMESNLPLGLSFSPDGQQLALFQEPMIGDWKDGSLLKDGDFVFKLYGVSESLLLSEEDMDDIMVSLDIEPSESEFVLSNAASHIRSLQSFLGFAKFFPPARKSPDVISDMGSINQPTRFAACNGLELNIYKCGLDRWHHTTSIVLTDLSPMMSRRINCQVMVESMGINSFMWIESDGNTVSTWRTDNGANICYLSSEKHFEFTGRIRRGRIKIAISPDESIVATTGSDGSLRTFFSASGIEISAWQTNLKIEYIGFISNDRMVAVLRDSAAYKLESIIIDPLDLRNRNKSNPVPTPKSGLTSLMTDPGKNRQDSDSVTVCYAEGKTLRFYRAQVALENPVSATEDEFLDPKLNKMSIKVDVHGKRERKYKLKIESDKKSLDGGEGRFYWVLRVVLTYSEELSELTYNIARFVPEPWLRCPTNEYTIPWNLLTAHFIPDKERFVIIGFQSIQIWSLPTKNHKDVSLLAFWSKPRRTPSEGYHRNKVYNYFEKIEFAKVYKNKSETTKLKVKLVVDDDGINSEPERVEDIVLPCGEKTAHYGIIPCLRSIHLIASAYAFAKNSKYNDDFETHADSFVGFSNQYIHRTVPLDNLRCGLLHKDYNHDSIDMLSFLINADIYEDDDSIQFIRALLASELDRSWIPREESVIPDPIKTSANRNKREVVHILANYCLRRAKAHHPAYLTPVIRNLEMLNTNYPGLVKKVFYEASNVKAKNKSFVVANAIVARPPYLFWEKNKRPLSDYADPVFSLLSQLPTNNNSLPRKIFKMISRQGNITRSFPKQRLAPRDTVEKSTNSLSGNQKHFHQIYVAPFPELSAYPKDGKTLSNGFSNVVSKGLLRNSAMNATLRYKWYKFGMIRWAARFLLVLAFSLLFIFIATGYSFGTDIDDFVDRQDSAIYIMLSLGGMCLLYEMRQFCLDWNGYFSTPYNYFNLAAFLMPTIGYIHLIIIEGGDQVKLSPKQVWWIGFALLAIYINLIFELKVLQPLGTAVHILINITRKVLWFLAVFVIVLVAFTHAFVHLTHSRNLQCGGSPDAQSPDAQTSGCATKYPDQAIPALFSTFFFLAGIYNPIEDDLSGPKGNDTSFKVLLALYVFFTVIMLMNVLIAIMNDGYSESRDEGELAWLKQWSEVILESELFLMNDSTRQNRDFFPNYIFYGTSVHNRKNPNSYLDTEYQDEEGADEESRAIPIIKNVERSLKNVNNGIHDVISHQMIMMRQQKAKDLGSNIFKAPTNLTLSRAMTATSTAAASLAAANTSSKLPLLGQAKVGGADDYSRPCVVTSRESSFPSPRLGQVQPTSSIELTPPTSGHTIEIRDRNFPGITNRTGDITGEIRDSQLAGPAVNSGRQAGDSVLEAYENSVVSQPLVDDTRSFHYRKDTDEDSDIWYRRGRNNYDEDNGPFTPMKRSATFYRTHDDE